MIAALYSPKQRAVHVEPLADFVATEAAAVRKGNPATWRIVGVGTDDEARQVADVWARRRDVVAKLAAKLRVRRQAKEAA
jgi:hypothetical protein